MGEGTEMTCMDSNNIRRIADALEKIADKLDKTESPKPASYRGDYRSGEIELDRSGYTITSESMEKK